MKQLNKKICKKKNNLTNKIIYGNIKLKIWIKINKFNKMLAMNFRKGKIKCLKIIDYLSKKKNKHQAQNNKVILMGINNKNKPIKFL